MPKGVSTGQYHDNAQFFSSGTMGVPHHGVLLHHLALCAFSVVHVVGLNEDAVTIMALAVQALVGGDVAVHQKLPELGAMQDVHVKAAVLHCVVIERVYQHLVVLLQVRLQRLVLLR